MRGSLQVSRQAGFTAVEVLMTIVVATIFILSLYLLYSTLTTSSAADRNRANANDLAYGYLRRYASADSTPLTWSTAFTCNTASDLTANTGASGQILESGVISNPPNGLATPVSYSVTALAIYGCSGTNAKKTGAS